MQRRSFLEKSLVAAMATAVPGMVHAKEAGETKKSGKEIYEWRRYFFSDVQAKMKFDAFGREFLVPRFTALGIPVAVFFEEPEGSDAKPNPLILHLLSVHKSLETYGAFKEALFTDRKFIESTNKFYRETSENPLYSRFETFLLESFEKFPKLASSPERRLFQMRLYESPNEEAGQRKIKMFNEGEMAIFQEVGLNIAFFGELLTGPQMPGLLYALSFKNMEECRAAWGKFGGHPSWKTMSADPVYANTVSKVNNVYLTPRNYSTL